MGHGIHPFILLQGDVHHPAFVGVHGLQLHPAAGTDGFFRHLAGQGGQGLFPAFTVAFHVQHQAGVFVTALVHGQVDQILQGIQGLAPPSDEDAQIVAAHGKPEDALFHLGSDLRGHAQLGEDGIQEGPGVGIEAVRHLAFGDVDGMALTALFQSGLGRCGGLGGFCFPLGAFGTLAPFHPGLAVPAVAALTPFFLPGGRPFRVRLGGDDGTDLDILGLFGLLGGLFVKFFPLGLLLAEGGGLFLLFRLVGLFHVGGYLEIPAADPQETGLAGFQHVPVVQLIDGGIGQGADVGDSLVQGLAGGHVFLTHI